MASHAHQQLVAGTRMNMGAAESKGEGRAKGTISGRLWKLTPPPEESNSATFEEGTKLLSIATLLRRMGGGEAIKGVKEEWLSTLVEEGTHLTHILSFKMAQNVTANATDWADSAVAILHEMFSKTHQSTIDGIDNKIKICINFLQRTHHAQENKTRQEWEALKSAFEKKPGVAPVDFNRTTKSNQRPKVGRDRSYATNKKWQATQHLGQLLFAICCRGFAIRYDQAVADSSKKGKGSNPAVQLSHINNVFDLIYTNLANVFG